MAAAGPNGGALLRTGLSPGGNQPMGIRLSGLRNISARYNEVRFVPYAGIGVGWQFEAKSS